MIFKSRLNYIFGLLIYLLFSIWSYDFKIFQSSLICTPPLLYLVLSIICLLVMQTWPIRRGTYIRVFFFFQISSLSPPSCFLLPPYLLFFFDRSSSISPPSSIVFQISNTTQHKFEFKFVNLFEKTHFRKLNLKLNLKMSKPTQIRGKWVNLQMGLLVRI